MESTMRKAMFTALALLGIAFGGVAVPVPAHAVQQHGDIATQDGNAA
jgi:hypothetical protein